MTALERAGTVRALWCRLERGASSIMLQQAEDEDGSAAGSRGLKIDQPSVAYYGYEAVVRTRTDWLFDLLRKPDRGEGRLILKLVRVFRLPYEAEQIRQQ